MRAPLLTPRPKPLAMPLLLLVTPLLLRAMLLPPLVKPLLLLLLKPLLLKLPSSNLLLVANGSFGSRSFHPSLLFEGH
jgi:hypothetical protein